MIIVIIEIIRQYISQLSQIIIVGEFETFFFLSILSWKIKCIKKRNVFVKKQRNWILFLIKFDNSKNKV